MTIVQNKYYLFLVQFLGYLWNFSLYIVVLPFLLIRLGEGLDFLIFNIGLGFDPIGFWSLVPASIIQLIAFLLMVFGIVMIAESAITLYQQARTFPFTFIPHVELTPVQLVKSGWYAHTRHPMVFGYLMILFGLSIYVQSISLLVWWLPITAVLMLEYAFLVEEKRLQVWFGQEYEKYRQDVPILWPRFSLYVGRQ